MGAFNCSTNYVNRTYFKEISETKNVSFAKDLVPIIKDKCMKCHGQNFVDYNYMFLKKNEIFTKVVVEKSMPLTGTLTNKQRALFRDWANQGGKL